MLWDTHTHLQADCFAADRAEVCARALAAGVGPCVLVGVGEEDLDVLPALASEIHGAPIALGVHPLRLAAMEMPDASRIAGMVTLLREAVTRHSPCAVGEIGLDAKAGHEELQERLVREQLAVARAAELPVLLHCRRRFEPLMKILRRDGVPARGGIYHAFSGSKEMLDTLCAEGFRIGLGGPLTYANATRLRELAANVPLDRVVLETDCPDLPPEPYRGHRNEPAYLRRVFEVLCSVRRETPEELERVLDATARELFGDAW